MQPLENARPHRYSVAEYMASDLDGRTELLGGIVYDVSPRNEPHRYAVRMLVKILAHELGPAYVVQAQDAIAVSGWLGNDAPEVDVAVIADRWYDPMPTAEAAFALIEVSDTTYRDDRNVKIPLYVAAGVPAFIVNIRERYVEGYASDVDLRSPHGRVFGAGEAIEILGVRIPVDSLFSPRESEDSA